MATTGQRVDDIQLRLGGSAAAFGTVEPDDVHLYPGSTADVAIRFTPTRGPSVAAGIHPWTLTATSVTHEGAVTTIDGTVDVAPSASGSCTLHPIRTSGRGAKGLYAVLLDNTGNIPWVVSIHPEPGSGVRFDTPDAALTVAPGSSVEAPIVARTSRHWVGAPRTQTFDVHVEPTSEPAPEPTTLTGTREQLPFLPLWLLPLLLVLIGLAFAAIALFGGDAVAVPAVAGQTRDQAVGSLEDAGFAVTEIIVSDADVPARHAVRTDPSSGTEVGAGSAVTLYVSAGPPTKEVLIPPVVGLTLEQARAQLQEVELEVRVVPESSDSVPDQTVTRSVPDAGSAVERGFTVVVYVSTGAVESPAATPVDTPEGGTGGSREVPTEPAASFVPVPPVDGRTVAEATAALRAVGLLVGAETAEPSDTVPIDHVIRTSPENGAEVGVGDEVDVVVSSGPVTIRPYRIEAESPAERSPGIQLGEDQGIGFLSYITDGAWATYSTGGLGSGALRSVTVSIASDTNGGEIELRLDGADGPVMGRCAIPGTGGWLEWQTVECDVQATRLDEPSQLYLAFNGQGTRVNPYLFNVDWIELG